MAQKIISTNDLPRPYEMVWSIFPKGPEKQGIDYVDIGTSAPDGTYFVEFNYLGSRGLGYGVTVKDGAFEIQETTKAVAQAVDMVGYWGEFIERLDYDAERDMFVTEIGS